MKEESLFIDKKPLQSEFVPDTILHREDQIHQIIDILVPSLKIKCPSNLFLYGLKGTGKTLAAKFVIKQLQDFADSRRKEVFTHYIDCKQTNTEHRIFLELARLFWQKVSDTGIPTEQLKHMFYEAANKQDKKIIILVFDGIDHLTNEVRNKVLGNLLNMNSTLKKAQICIVGISNDILLTERLDPKVKDLLCEEELIFPPYNAQELSDILKQRSVKTFKENSIDYELIKNCAAYASREHGDVRRALELLLVTGELAQNCECDKVELEHLNIAEEKIELERVTDIITKQPKQRQIVLYAILVCILDNKNNHLFTRIAFETYKRICDKIKLKSLTINTVSHIISELEMRGIINAEVISKGRYGRTKWISLAINIGISTKIKNMLSKCLKLKE